MAIWLLFSSSWPLLPVRLLVALIHEAGHAIAIQLLGADVDYVIINKHGGGLTSGHLDSPTSTTARMLVSSAGYVGRPSSARACSRGPRTCDGVGSR